MEDRKVIAREYISVTHCELGDDGYWTATNDVHDKVLYEGETVWVDESIHTMSIDTNPQEAIKVAMNSNLQYIVTNVYQNGFKSLIEYRDYERSLGKGKEGNAVETPSN